MQKYQCGLNIQKAQVFPYSSDPGVFLYAIPSGLCILGRYPTNLYHKQRSTRMKKSIVLATLLIAAFAFVAGVSARGKGAVKVEFSPNDG